MKSVRKYYEIDRSYDRADFDTLNGRRIVKRRAHRRLRSQMAKETAREIRACAI